MVSYDDDVVVAYCIVEEIGCIVGIVELYQYLCAAFAAVVLVLNDCAGGNE